MKLALTELALSLVDFGHHYSNIFIIFLDFSSISFMVTFAIVMGNNSEHQEAVANENKCCKRIVSVERKQVLVIMCANQSIDMWKARVVKKNFVMKGRFIPVKSL